MRQDKRRRSSQIISLEVREINRVLSDLELRLSQMEGVGANADFHGGKLTNVTGAVRDREALTRQNISEPFKVGDILLTFTATNPAITRGYGTWVHVAEGLFLVGQKTGDVDFGTVGAKAGTLSHGHTIAEQNTEGPDDIQNDTALGGAGARTRNHFHKVPQHNSDEVSHKPPAYVLHVWRRTA